MSKANMSSENLQKIQLKEIRDYRGNLSFAEQDNPIPFDIKSVFWTSIETQKKTQTEQHIFLICLDGSLEIKSSEETLALRRPCEACLIYKGQDIILKPLSTSCKLLFVMDSPILQDDQAHKLDNQLIQMPYTNDFLDCSGCFVNSNSSLPFDIKRVYFTYDIPSFAKRGGHAHINLESIIFPLKGQFEVIYHQQNLEEKCQILKDQHTGLHLKKETWRELDNFEDNSVVLVLASDIYLEEDYIRYHSVFTTYAFDKA